MYLLHEVVQKLLKVGFASPGIVARVPVQWGSAEHIPEEREQGAERVLSRSVLPYVVLWSSLCLGASLVASLGERVV